MSFRPRVIPCLLLSDQGIVKTLKFKDPVYVGDPINTVKIFNDFEADELMLLNINTTEKRIPIDYKLIKRIAEEAYMPLSYGGGIQTLDDAAQLINSGVEKVVLNSVLIDNKQLVKSISKSFGAQSVVVCLDVKYTDGKYQAYGKRGTTLLSDDVITLIKELEDLGAGEILLQFVDRDGTQSGYDYQFIGEIAKTATVPLIASGGASSLEDIKKVTTEFYASAAAAGSLFCFMGSRRSVLINYPEKEEFAELFN